MACPAEGVWVLLEEQSRYALRGKTGAALIAQLDDTAVPDHGIAIWHFGQESMAVKTKDGTIVYFDPYFTSSPKHNFAAPLRPEDVTNADYVFVSHHHDDHLHPATLRGIAAASPQARFLCPVPHVRLLLAAGIAAERIIACRAGEPLRLGAITATGIASKHEEFMLDAEGNHGFLGYVLDLDGVVFYHAGDTVPFPELIESLRPHRVEIACLPINGRDFKRFAQHLIGNMNFREAADLTDAIGADLVIPMHYDLFAHNTDNPAYFVDYLHHAYPMQRFKMFVPGERYLHLSERGERA